jgi:hypothetical protein
MEDRYARYGAATGIAFVVLMVVSFIVMPTPPDLDAPVGEWAGYYAEDQNAINTALVLVSVALFFFVWFLGTLVSALRGRRGARGCRRSPSAAASLPRRRSSSGSPWRRSPPTAPRRSPPS